ncbi:MAG: hypothetical protein KF734_21465 [Saprospiraceae bacterium]|nr:hypothetical protein [Saprospiraceae bacterium]
MFAYPSVALHSPRFCNRKTLLIKTNTNMDVLQDIAYIITRYKVREVDVITNSSNKKPGKTESRYWEFYVGLRENRWKDEEEAARYFGMEPASKQFNRFKNELKKRLLNTLFFIDFNTSDFNEFSRVSHELIKEWSTAKILIKRGAIKAFMDIANKCLRSAQKFENVTMIVEIVRTIKSVVVVYPGLHKEVPKLDKILEEYQKAMFAELMIQNAYDSFLYLVVGQKGYKKSLAPVAEQILNEYAPLAKEHDHVLLQTFYRTIIAPCIFKGTRRMI